MPANESTCPRCGGTGKEIAKPAMADADSAEPNKPLSEEATINCEDTLPPSEENFKKSEPQAQSDALHEKQNSDSPMPNFTQTAPIQPAQHPAPAYLTAPNVNSQAQAQKTIANDEPSYRRIQPKSAAPDSLTIADYFGMLVLSAIPFAGFIVLLVWAFGSTAGENRRNFSKALLLLKVVLGAFVIVLAVVVMVAVFAFDQMYFFY